jgi:hypothetical protein
MDNFSFDMTSEGDATLRKAFLLFPSARKAVGFRIDGKRFVLYWADSPKMSKLPYPMSPEPAVELLVGWLAQVDYGRQPDHDGDNGKGWRLFTEKWGHVDGEWQAYAAVEPVWAMYGK